jgi:hypothetical protein
MATVAHLPGWHEAADFRLGGPYLDGMIRGALIIGFLGAAVGGVVAEKLLGLNYDAGLQWAFAVGGSGIGAVWGFVVGRRGRHN